MCTSKLFEWGRKGIKIWVWLIKVDLAEHMDMIPHNLHAFQLESKSTDIIDHEVVVVGKKHDGKTKGEWI